MPTTYGNDIVYCLKSHCGVRGYCRQKWVLQVQIICKFSNERTCKRNKDVQGLSCGFEDKYIVMNFDNEKFSMVLNKIHPTKLLLLDFGKFEKEKYSYICQDFDEAFYQALLMLKEKLRHYPQLVLLFSKNLKHPQSSKEYFTRFCEEQGFLCEIQEDIENLTVRKGVVYIAIKQQDVVKVVKQGRLEGLKCGRDFGLLAYNDIPSYEVIDEGITSLSIDWEMMGNEAANFVLNNVPIQKYLPTEVRLRKSL
ncbi:Periplasmic binding protein-like domain protein [Bacteroides thetaiotaomicron]|nr:Periplasmic binding protein-like domain protein [Bacteroides thetaiotaomicron]